MAVFYLIFRYNLLLSLVGLKFFTQINIGSGAEYIDIFMLLMLDFMFWILYFKIIFISFCDTLLFITEPYYLTALLYQPNLCKILYYI